MNEILLVHEVPYMRRMQLDEPFGLLPFETFDVPKKRSGEHAQEFARDH